MKKIQLIYCTPDCLGVGAPHFFVAASWLKSHGFDIRIVCGGQGGSTQYSHWQGIPVTSLSGTGVGVGFQTQLAQKLLRQRRCGRKTIYYINRHTITPAAYIALAGVPRHQIIYHTQDFIEPGRHPHWEFFEKRFAQRAGWVISNEVNRARALMSLYGLQQMPTVVTTALPKDWPRPERDENLRRSILAKVGRVDDDNCRLIMHEGGFAPVRCGRQLVEAFCRLPDNYLLVFTGMKSGSPASRQLQQLVGSLGLEKRVVILERLTFEDLMRHTACCDAGILLYPNDGIGNFYQCPGRLTHYLGCGLPIIASNFPGLELLTLKYKLGAVCDPQLSEAIADAILSVAGRPRWELAKQALRLKQIAQNEMAYEAQAGRIEDILEKIASAL